MDTSPPAVIEDLTVIEMTRETVRLQWTAPGDDHDSGTAAIYDLRYLQHEITSSNWDSAASVQGLMAPNPSGTYDSATVIDLLEDSTYYFAIRAADEAGNWSNLSNVPMAVCFDDYAVSFPDTAFERVIRFYVGKPIDSVFRSDLLTVWSINASNQHIQNISGIEHCKNLRSLQLWNNRIHDLTPLTEMNQLRILKIGYNGLTDISALSLLVDLDTLHLNANIITDLSPLAEMNSLRELVLTSNSIWNIAPLTGKTNLRNLSLDANQIVFVNALYDLTGIEKLTLSANQIDDLLPLAFNLGLGEGDSLWLTGNPLSAPTTDSLMTVLRDRGVSIIR